MDIVVVWVVVEVVLGLRDRDVAGGELSWPSAATAGDILRLEGTVTTITRSRSRPGQAWVVVEHRTLNQRDEVRQINYGRLLAWQRPSA